MRNQYYSAASSFQALPSSNQSFASALKAVLRFMVHRPKASAQPPNTAFKDRYRSKASLYAYLPDTEEQRDWLERTYRGQ